MNPYLTTQGKWLFVTAAVFIVGGAAVGQPMLVLLGVVPVVVLLVALVWLLPTARSVDRREVRFCGEQMGGVVKLSAGGSRKLTLWLENSSRAALRVIGLRGYAPGAVEVEILDDRWVVEGGEAGRLEVLVQMKGVGRASLQGFDIEITDRFGLLRCRDYLPCLHIFEAPVPMRPVQMRERRVGHFARRRGVRVANRVGHGGTQLRELRDFQPGDPPRKIAWKATVRHGRLVTREFDDERMADEWVALDISSSMRAGRGESGKFDHALELAAGLCADYLQRGRSVGLWTFDNDLYGGVESGRGTRQRRRIRRHLTGVTSTVEASRTALDDREVERALADYLLVQQRLDFRRGRGLDGEVDAELLYRWVGSVLDEERERWRPGRADTGVVGESAGPIREFFRLRALPLAPPAELGSGAKLKGIEQVVRQMVRHGAAGGRLTIITDLCGINDVDRLRRGLRLLRRRDIQVRFVVTFTPLYASASAGEEELEALVRDVFARGARRDRMEVAEGIAALGAEVQFVGPKRTEI